MVSYEECSNSVAPGRVGTVLAFHACNWAWMTLFSSRRAWRSTSCFYLSATIYSTFFFWRASNYSRKLWIREASSISNDMIGELLVVTIYSCDQRKISLGPRWASNVLTKVNVSQPAPICTSLSLLLSVCMSFFSCGGSEFLERDSALKSICLSKVLSG